MIDLRRHNKGPPRPGVLIAQVNGSMGHSDLQNKSSTKDCESQDKSTDSSIHYGYVDIYLKRSYFFIEIALANDYLSCF